MAYEYPEHEKLAQVQEKSQAIGEFLDWLDESKHLHLCEIIADRTFDFYQRTRLSKNDILSEFFGIDEKKLEIEKQQMLEELRAAQ